MDMHGRINALALAVFFFPAIPFAENVPNQVDSLTITIDTTAGLMDYSQSEALAKARTIGGVEVVSGLVCLPLGLALAVGNSFSKCEEVDGGTILGGGFGPCSRSGPSAPGQMAGLGIMIAGLVLIADGIRRLSGD
ncbi:MAG: hypothetical protein ABI036_19280 [Fibrobacteria bacterium]